MKMPSLIEIQRSNSDIPDDALRVAVRVFSEVTFSPLVPIINFFLLKKGIYADFNVGDFDQISPVIDQDLSDGARYDFVYLHTSIIKYYVRSVRGMQTENERLENQLNDYIVAVNKLITAYPQSSVVINTLEYPPFRPRGSVSRLSGAVGCVGNVNEKIVAMVRDCPNLLLHDLGYISAKAGLDNYFDFKFWAGFKQPFSGKALVSIGASLASILLARLGYGKKVLVTDLDDTLWGGVIGDDGVSGIKSGMHSPAGEIYWVYQNYLADLKGAGIPLAIVSKNELMNVLPAFEGEKVKFSLDDFSSVKVGWGRKSDSIKQVGLDLNLDVHDFVFVDDNPAEISEVEVNTRGCDAIEFEGSVLNAIKLIDDLNLFETQTLSREDLDRSHYYFDNQRRREFENSVEDQTEFLKSLDMEATVRIDATDEFDRIISLTNKTNQFNMTQMKVDHDSVEGYVSDPRRFVVTSNLSDKFGDNGIVSVIYVRLAKRMCVIDNWVMSCRVFGREFEYFLLDWLMDYLRSLEIDFVRAHNRFTERNQYCRDVYHTFGFVEVTDQEGIGAEWVLDVRDKKMEYSREAHRKGRFIKANK